MANIDWGTLALGALVGIGCRKQIKSAARVATVTVASLAGVAAEAAAQVAAEAGKSQSAEERAAAERLAKIDQQISQQAGQGKNG